MFTWLQYLVLVLPCPYQLITDLSYQYNHLYFCRSTNQHCNPCYPLLHFNILSWVPKLIIVLSTNSIFNLCFHSVFDVSPFIVLSKPILTGCLPDSRFLPHCCIYYHSSAQGRGVVSSLPCLDEKT